jgi:hypothetical protein
LDIGSTRFHAQVLENLVQMERRELMPGAVSAEATTI